MNTPYFIFDCESIGLYGQTFAVAGVIFHNGEIVHEFCYSCPRYAASGQHDDRAWVEENIPRIEDTHRNPVELRDAFWDAWTEAKIIHPGITMAADCTYPVEAGFLIECVKDYVQLRKWSGPYPLVDIASIMVAAGMDPTGPYPRLENELPIHHPLADAKQSARLLFEALNKITLTQTTHNEKDSKENSSKEVVA